MKVVHGIIGVVFAIIAASIFMNTDGEKRTPTLIAALISNVSFAAISIESALDRSRPGIGMG